MLTTLRINARTGLVLLFIHAATIGLRAAEPELPKSDGNTAPAVTNPLLTPPPVESLPTVQAPATATRTPTGNVTINLINALVKKGVLTADEAQGMVTQAEQEAATVQAQLAEVAAPPVVDGDVRVTYIPETVRNQIREGVKADMMAAAKAGDIKFGGMAPEWTERIKFFGDIRMRFETDMLKGLGNDNTGSFPNFNAINTGAPFDVAGTQFSPQYNVDQDRYRLRIRARLGADIDLADHWYAGIRIGTGQDNSPISGNQSLGKANGQGGNFSKYDLWLDRAFIKYERGSPLADGLAFNFGRFDNPFFSTSLTWQDEIGFDGISLRGSKAIGDSSSLSFTGGLFPIFNTEFTFPSNQPAKYRSTDRYLYAAQLVADFKLTEKIHAKFGAAYYDFQGIEGKLSTPFIPLTAQDAGDTDNTRPSFAQRGNTYRALRQIVPSAINNFGTSNQFQYFGLASPFKEAVLTGKIDFNNWEPYQLSLIGEYAKNTAWNKDQIEPIAVNNRGADPAKGQIGVYDGSDTAWLMKVQFGKEKFEKAGDWRASIDYRWIGSDAVVDAFNDDDFGDGGTNLEGFTMGAQVALSKRVNIGLRWFSASQITGPPFKSDIFMLDLSAKF